MVYCIHYWIIRDEDGVKVGRCKKCGQVQFYSRASGACCNIKNKEGRYPRGEHHHRIHSPIDEASGSWSNAIRGIEE